MTRWVLGLAVVVLLGVGVGAVAMRSGAGSGSMRGAADHTEDVASAAVGGAMDAASRAGVASAAPGSAAGESGTTADPDAPGGAGEAAEADADVTAPATAVELTPDPSVDWAAPDAPSPVKPLPAEQRVPKPEAVRGIYVGAWPVGAAERFEELVRLADETEVNAFVIDVKDVTGAISYGSRVPLAEQVGATKRRKIGDIRARLETLREHGIYPIARIVVFKDPLLATARPDWAIEREDGSIWEDNNGVRWVDSYNRNVWDYNIELAREAIALGFSEIQWDYVRFADVPRSYLVEAVYPAREGRTKADGIRAFMTYSKERLADLDVPVTADVFGITTSAFADVGIGQVWEKMSDVMDVLLPMVYPSHYPRGSWEYENPNAAPYQIVKKAMDHGVGRSKDIENAAGIRPWLQAFTLGEPEYGPRHVRAQIDAVYDAGLTEWILWNPSVRYSAEAFATADGREPWFAGMGESLYEGPLPEPDEPEPDTTADALGEPVGGR